MNKFRKISAILCAAGLSSRMGAVNKLLLPYKGKTLIEYSVEQLIKTDVHEIIVVVGYQKEMIESLIASTDFRLKLIHNQFYESGQTSTIQAGIAACSDDTEAVMVCLSDMPLLTGNHMNNLLDYRDDIYTFDAPSIYRPKREGKPGHPVIFDSHFFSEILTCTNMDGCRPVIRNHMNQLRLYTTSDKAFVMDIDTMNAYHQLEDTNFHS